MKRTLIVADTIDWAICRLCTPLKKIGVDTAYHYINTSKGTGIEEKNPVHLTIDLLKKYDQYHFTTARAVDSILRNKEALEAMKDKRIIMTVYTERDSEFQMIKQNHWKQIDHFICPTKYNQERIEEIYPNKTTYIPLAIDEKKYSYTEDYPRKTNVVGYIGRVMPHKRLKSIVEASGGYQVVGIGYVDNEGHDYWHSIPKGNLTMYQNLSEDEKIDIMRNFTVLVSVSDPHIETGPLGVLECAALGIPIITTNVGWARDMLTEDSAYFINDMNNLKGFIHLVIGYKEAMEKNRKNARKVIDDWTLDMYINKHKEVYKKVDKKRTSNS